MAITLELPPDIEASLAAQARARGLRLDAMWRVAKAAGCNRTSRARDEPGAVRGRA